MSGFPLVSETAETKPNQLTKAVQEVQPWYNCTTTDMKVSCRLSSPPPPTHISTSPHSPQL